MRGRFGAHEPGGEREVNGNAGEGGGVPTFV